MQNNDLTNCYNRGNKTGERHTGVRRISPNNERSKEHLLKAEHNLKAIDAFYEINYSDWSASAAFYTLYHCLLALLAQHGYESRSQNCTFELIKSLVADGKITFLTVEEVQEIYDKDITEDLEHSSRVLDIRENMQYGIRTTMSETEFYLLRNRTKQLFDKMKLEIERTIK